MGSKMDQQPMKDFVNLYLKKNIKSYMTEMNLWEDCMDFEIPNSYQKYYNYVLIKDTYFKHANWKAAGIALWKLISGLLGGIPNIALYGKISNDAFRSPNVVVVYGNDAWVKFLDNGIKFTWRVDRVMFSRGNLVERHRIGKLDCRNQVVVDMFAGIGYFTLPYLVHAKAVKVHAFEWNPAAMECLVENLKLNHVLDKCTYTLGNVKQICPAGIADHVNMGLIPSCEEYWDTGARALKPTGGILRIHGIITIKPSPSNRTESLRTEDTEEVDDKCIKCVTALRALNLLLSSSLITKDRKAYFAMELLPSGRVNYTPLEGNGCVWKKSAFLEWSMHVTHSIALSLVNIHGVGWRIKPVYFNRIKKYAPHMFHVVVDVHCEPLYTCM